MTEEDLHAVVHRHEHGGWTWQLKDGTKVLTAHAPYADGGLSRRCARRRAKRALNDERYRRCILANPQREEIR